MAYPGYAKSEIEVLRECEKALIRIQKCIASDGTKCAPNDSDFDLVASALDSIAEYKELRNIPQ